MKEDMASINNLSAFLIVPFLFLFPGQDASCRSSKMDKPPEEKVQRVPAGLWGGTHIILNVTNDGATVAMDCARGTINQPMEMDGTGHFDVKGTFIAESPGPTRPGGETGRSVRYSGAVKGKSMTLTIVPTGTDETLGTFTLTQGKQGRIWKCL
jgi:hypothetical protein